MRYKIYTNTERAWDAMLESIKGAKSSILFEMYIFSDNTSESHDFVEILSQKARSGVIVKIIFDSLGSGELSSAVLNKLKSAGVEVLFFRKLFRYSHRKVLVIDERLAYIGGVNIDKFFKKWHDLQIRMEGRVVKHIMRSFARLYKKCGGSDAFVLKHDKPRLVQKGKMWFFEHFTNQTSFRLDKYYRDKIDYAREKILIVTPYLMPNQWVIDALIKASKRGVLVEIILPQNATNPRIVNLPNYLYMNKLYPSGVKVFLTREMVHSKMMLVDGSEGILGSQNVDVFSFDLNMESGVFFTEKELIDNLYGAAEEWKEGAVLFTPKMRQHFLLDHLVDVTMGIFKYMIQFFNLFKI